MVCSSGLTLSGWSAWEFKFTEFGSVESCLEVRSITHTSLAIKGWENWTGPTLNWHTQQPKPKTESASLLKWCAHLCVRNSLRRYHWKAIPSAYLHKNHRMQASHSTLLIFATFLSACKGLHKICRRRLSIVTSLTRASFTLDDDVNFEHRPLHEMFHMMIHLAYCHFLHDLLIASSHFLLFIGETIYVY